MNRTAVFLSVLCTALLVSNTYLLYVNNGLSTQHQIDEAMQLPKLGAPMAAIAVHGAQGAEHSLVFQSGNHDHLLLVMSPDCPYCRKNWPMWDTLLKNVPSNIDVTYFDVTGKFDKRVSRDHGIKEEQIVTAPLDSALRAHIIGTPTTILIARDGNVRHVWEGVLDEGQVKEIVAVSKTDAVN